MTKKTLSQTSGGSTVVYTESAEDRRRRLIEAEKKYAVKYSEAQRRALREALKKG